MHYAGIDLHKRNLVVGVERGRGKAIPPIRFNCRDTIKIVSFFKRIRPFKAVIEASSTYRWLYELLSPHGQVILAHPLKLRAIVSGRAKTDKLDAVLLAKLLKMKMIPESYVPPKRYQLLRDLTRGRIRIVRDAVCVKQQLHYLLSRSNITTPYKHTLCNKGLKWMSQADFGMCDNLMRDELIRRLEHYQGELKTIDAHLENTAHEFPELEAIQDLFGFGLFTAMVVIGEIGEVERFKDARKVGCYAGLTARVNQSGGHEYYGNISKQGSSWLRWVLVMAAMKIVRKDEKLRNFYNRIRKRSSAKIARVAVARKLACICWVRLKCWHKLHRQAA